MTKHVIRGHFQYICWVLLEGVTSVIFKLSDIQKCYERSEINTDLHE